jgi:ABC-type dipeptide/oligopeptide/nickel transport system permease component
MAILTAIRQRLFSVLPVLFGISLISFLLVQLSPGDPVRLMLGERATEETVRQVRDRLGLNDSLLQQYVSYMRHILQGDLGYSLRFQKPVVALIMEFLPPTLFMIAYVLIISIPVTLLFSVIAARNRDRWPDQLIRFFTIVGMTFPVFWLALMMSRLFGVELRWFPVSGYGASFMEHLHHLFLPTISIAAWLVPLLSRNLRATLIKEMDADYVVACRAKGVGERSIFINHVLMNSLLPTLNLLGVMVAFLIGSSVVVEIVYVVPGIGTLMINSVLGRDFYVIQGLTLVYAVFTVLVTFAIDMISSLIDPRVKL